jgi:demethylmenaquinone methyltransferase/2-methoxy-6-polyprenyl-1,4-benzoquinol methylase
VRRARLEPGLPVLDVCTGTGDLALAFWRRGKGRIPVVGADFTHEMLQLARRKVPHRKADANAPLEFLEADAQHLPFGDRQFQVVSVAFGLRNVTDTRQGLREMARVCRPGGRVMVLEFSLPENRLIRGVYRWYFRNILPRLGQMLARNSHAAYEYLPQSVAEFPQGAELAGMMTECGLTAVTWTPLTFGIATLYVGTRAE